MPAKTNFCVSAAEQQATSVLGALGETETRPSETWPDQREAKREATKTTTL